MFGARLLGIRGPAEGLLKLGLMTPPQAPTASPSPPSFDYTPYYAAYDPSVSGSLFQDTAGTTPATAQGDPVRRVNDLSGNGRHLLLVAGLDYWVLNVSSGLYWLTAHSTPVASGSQLAVAFTLAQRAVITMMLRQISYNSSAAIFSPQASTTQLPYLLQEAATPTLNGWFGASTSNVAATIGTDRLITYDANGTSSLLQVDEGAAVTNASGGTAAFTGFALGGGGPFGKDTADIRFYGATISSGAPANNSAMRTRLYSRAGL